MQRRQFLQSALAAASLAQSQAARRPNIVLIVADDLGYGGIGAYGERELPTPHIDSIAANGVRYTSGYVSCPVCSPTRAGLMTGRYQQRFGHEFNPGPAQDANDTFGLPLTEITVADRLKKLGYATGMVGKWHLGYRPDYHPLKRGFDEFFGFLGGAHSFVDPLGDRANPILRGTEAVDEKEYLTDAFAREAVAFIERRKGGPFFLYLPFNAVHAPMQAAQKYLDRFASITDPLRRTHAAMISAMDDGVGRVLDALKKNDLTGNTLVFFISDNGGPTQVNTSRNRPLSGVKGQVREGGIRVPFLMQWPGKIRAGTVADHPVIALDIHPTAIAAAGGKLDTAMKLDGVDLVAHLNAKTAPHEALYWRFGEQHAVRKGDWKLADVAGEAPQLYNLAKDVGEATNLAGSEPGKLAEMQKAYDAWNAQLVEPLWKRPNRGAGGKGGKKKRAF